MITATSTVELEQLSPETSRIWIVTTCDGAVYRNVHVGGPKHDVEAYWRGEIDIDELCTRMRRRGSR
jgi:hypothetical protein